MVRVTGLVTVFLILLLSTSLMPRLRTRWLWSPPVASGTCFYSPLAPPSGALIYDSIERKNATYAFDNHGGIGSTESGSLGSKVWQYLPDYSLTTTLQVFGTERTVRFFNGCLFPLRLRGCLTSEFGHTGYKGREGHFRAGSGGVCSIAFRFVDASNFWQFYVYPHATAGWVTWQVAHYVAGSPTVIGTASLASAQTVLRVVTKADGTYQIYLGSTLLTSGTSAEFATATKCGIQSIGETPL